MRTYLNTLLHRKRGAYGPLWVFELDPQIWAIVWSGWLEDEAACHRILSGDPEWFNRDWGMNGRRPNPTYETQRAALEEVIRSLQSMKVSLKHDEAEQRKYEIFISNAAHDLHQLLTSTQGEEVHNNALTAQGAKYATTAPEALGDGQANESAQGLGEPEKAPLTVAPQAPATKPKPWENPTDSPKGLNFHPEAELHAKMNWVCDNVPKMSRLRILREGAMMYCDQLIAMHYREEE